MVWPWDIKTFEFGWPEALLFLAVLPVLAGLYVWMQHQRRRYAVRYASVSLLRQAVGTGPGFKRHIPAIVYLAAIALMIVAMSRPTGVVSTSHNTGVVMLAIDVSGSMLAEDVTPNRMEATKKAVREFVGRQPDGVQIGVVSFSDFGIVIQPPTRERRPVLEAIGRLKPERGTNIGGGMQAALDAIYEGTDQPRPIITDPNEPASPFSPAQPTPVPTPASAASSEPPPPATIVLVSDGQSNTGPSPTRVAEEAVAAGIKVYTIGIGTPEGTVLRIQGRSVFTRLDEETLRQVADSTGGRYLNAQDEADLARVYQELDLERRSEDEETELTYALTTFALFTSIVGGMLSLLWFNRLP